MYIFYEFHSVGVGFFQQSEADIVVTVWQRINEMMQLWFMRFMWCEFGISVFLLFHMCLVMFYISIIIISSWMLLSKKGRIQFTALPWESGHVMCGFFCLKRIHHICPFQPLNYLSTPYYSNLIAKLPAYLASWYNLCLWFNFSSSCCSLSHTALKT